MEDTLTRTVLDYRAGKLSLDRARNAVLEAAFDHLRRGRRRQEDDISEFLLQFHPRVALLLDRFEDRGLPFRHYLLRTLRWQWHTYRSAAGRWAATGASEVSLTEGDGDQVAEPGLDAFGASRPPWPTLTPAAQRRLVLLTLKAAPWIDEVQLEAVSRHTGTDLAWLQACQRRLISATDRRRHRRQLLEDRRGALLTLRLEAENRYQREADPQRRAEFEARAAKYRERLARIDRVRQTTTGAPTHREVAELLAVPKGTVDSGLYHLKRHLERVYGSVHDHRPPGHQQPEQEG